MNDDVSARLQKGLRADLNTESESIKGIFSLVQDRLRNRTQRRGCASIIPLNFFTWARQDPSLDQVRSTLLRGQAYRGISLQLQQIHPQDPLRIAFDCILDLAEDFNISSGSDVCCLLGFVCQTVSGTDEARRKINEDIAKKFYPAANERLRKAAEYRQRQRVVRAYEANGGRPPQGDSASETRSAKAPINSSTVLERPAIVSKPQLWPNVLDRLDEKSGGLASADGICVWFATHVGPTYAQKGENQDAAYALSRGSRVFFALSDGVSTSVGSRFAAATIVKLFCQYLADRFDGSSASIDDESLKGAARSVQEWLNECLAYLATSPVLEEWTEVKGASNLSMDVVLQLAANTIKPKNRYWAPLMASTLLGGCVERASGGVKVSMIRVGDGISESIDRNGKITGIFSMDADETEITAVVGPGQASALAISKAESKLSFLDTGEILLLASDGLVRGHNDGLVKELQSVCPQELRGLNPRRDTAAMDILKKAADHADQAFKLDPERKLFADNLSLIALMADRM